MMHREQKTKITSSIGSKTYTEEYHLKNIPKPIKCLYEQIKEKITDLSDDIEVKPKKVYIAFVSNANFIYTSIHQKNIKILLNLKKGELVDPKNVAEDVSEIGRHGNGDYRITIEPDEDLSYKLGLINQAYNKHS